METIKAILVLVVTFILWRTYHKLFQVVYVNAAVGILREIVVCFVLACLIVSGVFSALGSIFHLDKSKNSSTDSSNGVSIFNTHNAQEEADIIRGNFYNTAFLDGAEGNLFDTWLCFGESETISDGIKISGYAYAEGFNYQQCFVVDIPRPDGNTFTCHDELLAGTLTITFHPEDLTLDVVQEPLGSDIPTPYEGSYVDDDTWSGLIDERRAAVEDIEAALEPDKWIEKYYGEYVLVPFAEGVEDSPFLWFEITAIRNDSTHFSFSNNLLGYHADEFFDYSIPFPRKGFSSTSDHIEYQTNEGTIAFNILEDSEDGLHRIELTEFPYPKYEGIYIDALEQVNPKLGFQGKLLTWDGTYVCRSDDEDGVKTITVTQIDEMTISVDMAHTYADGREDFLHADAEIGAFNDDPYCAYYRQERMVDFQLEEDPNTKQKIITVGQTGIYPAIDKEFSGVYIRE